MVSRLYIGRVYPWQRGPWLRITDSALAEEPLEAPRLSPGRTKPRPEATRWQSWSPVRRLVRLSDPPPPLLPDADAREEGRGRGTAARSGEPATAKLAMPSASSSAPSWEEEDGGVEPASGSAADAREEGRGRGTIALWPRRQNQRARHRQARHAVGELVRTVVGEEDGSVEPASGSAVENPDPPPRWGARRQIWQMREGERWLKRERGKEGERIKKRGGRG
ncbi:hypothetical protein [Oryza sativa Japonica Group]|uniref:Uncharacterized protein n=1 Tax=Oryza sativa subsp. japonica TaxID=39947 RepID=Q5QMR3_ORYSJ|nr:hypothetical protein [Oryza sativa Japonica Group]BAD73356.1 hypothetical protein [Oryza sativa Japonica Group]